MPPSPPEPQAPAIKLDDILFILFRYKWLIVAFSVLGLVAAGAVFFLFPPQYQSEAKVLIRYVLENRSVNPAGGDSQIVSPSGGDSIVQTEMEILRSLDLILAVVDAVGPEKILAKTGGGNDRYAAAGLLMKGLQVEVQNRTSVIHVFLQHPDMEIVRPVMQKILDEYLKKHVEVHRPNGLLDDVFSRQTDQLRARLAQTEDELRKLKAKAGVISLEEARRSLVEQTTHIRQEIYATEAELGERKAALLEMEKLAPSKSDTAASEVGVSLEKLNEYKSLSVQLGILMNKEREMLAAYTDENPMVVAIREQIAEAEKKKAALEKDSPKLATLSIPVPSTNAPLADVGSERMRVNALQAKLTVLSTQLESIRTNAAALDEAESGIAELQRRKNLAETNFMYFSSSLEQARLDEALGAGRLSNINVVQTPSPPSLELPKKTKKAILGALACGVLGGVGLAFLLEMFLRPTIKRSDELESKFHLPMFLSIPHAGRNGHAAPPQLSRKERKLLQQSGDASSMLPAPVGAPGQNGVAPWDAQHPLNSYSETLRDKLINFFESRNMTHKPKLVAVTGCNKGSGVTTIAAGLAASLSETGEGNVLLVDMNSEQGAAHPFFKGKPACSLPDLLDSHQREGAQIQENLYAVSAAGPNDLLPRATPKKFGLLVPKLKASDYDYIIFDMPPVNQTSITPRVANYMDMVLMVVENEKTNRGALKRAAAMLAQTGTNVGTVFNKSRNYLPGWLSQDT